MESLSEPNYYAVIVKHKTDSTQDFLLAVYLIAAKAEEYKVRNSDIWAKRGREVVVRTVKKPILEEIDTGYYDDQPESHGIFN